MFYIVIVSFLIGSINGGYLPQVEFVSLEPYQTWSDHVSDFGVYAANNHDNIAAQKGAELADIAKSSVSSAKNVVYNQNSAALRAEYDVKSSLASVAIGAAKTARAALTGKQAIFANLKDQLSAAQRQLKEELNQYHQAKAASDSAQGAAHKAQVQVNTLRVAVTEAETAARNAAAAAGEAGSVEAAQKEMVFESKQKIERLLDQLKYVGGDLKDIEYSASKASKAAHVANLNVINAAHKGAFNSYH